ncbi:MAG: hypothetical protein LBQ11_02120, partial [Candidatus Nomurabacteria bacterium]|nr:hypothetical protein [Candidatus Nomurabacteria bacterium]
MKNYIDDVISYDRTVKLGGIYGDQSVFLNMVRFFDDFKLVSDNNGDWLNALGFKDHNTEVAVDLESTSGGGEIANRRGFADVVRNDRARRYVLYSPLDPPYVTNPLVYIMNSPTIAHAYENKRYFREEFADLTTLPEHRIMRLDEINDNTYEELHPVFGKMVLQDVELSGSKGTIFAGDRREFYTAVEALKKISFIGTIVISKFIEGLSCSVQVCITKYGI